MDGVDGGVTTPQLGVGRSKLQWQVQSRRKGQEGQMGDRMEAVENLIDGAKWTEGQKFLVRRKQRPGS